MISRAPDSSVRPVLGPLGPTRLAALSVLTTALVFGSGNNGVSDASGNGAGATNGGGATGGDGADISSLVALCGVVLGEPPIDLVATLETVRDTANLMEALTRGANCSAWNGKLLVGQPEAPVFTRYDVPSPGTFVEEESVSFARLGVQRATGTNLVIGDQAFYVDFANLQVIVWSPATMTISETLDFSGGLEPEEGTTILTSIPIVAGDRITVPVRYERDQVQVSRMGFAFIDATANSVATDITESCGGLSWSVTDSRGDIYYSVNGFVASSFAVGVPGSFPPCVVRIKAGATEVDETFTLSLNELTGSPATAGLVPGPNDFRIRLRLR